MKSNIVKQFHAYGWDWYLVEDGRESWISESVKKHIEELEDENARLRNLASILCYCMHDEDCDGCKLNGENGEIVVDTLFACDGLHELLRELGIEVTDG